MKPTQALQTDLVRHPHLSWETVTHLAAGKQAYLGSPSIAQLADGTLVVANDRFGAGSPCDTTWVHASRDDGRTWQELAVLHGQWWSTLFLHEGALHLFGTTREYGATVIRRSLDCGRTWTTPDAPERGLLLTGARYHCAPQPMLIHEGRIWRAMEDLHGAGRWGYDFRSFLMSAPLGADLLRADSWTSSNRVACGPAHCRGWLEGNVVAGPDGRVRILLRVDLADGAEVAAQLVASADGRELAVDAAAPFVPFPGGAKKFTIRRDTLAACWWSVVSAADPRRAGPPADQRNRLVLTRSDVLRTWWGGAELLHHPAATRHGFQYVDWMVAGDDLLLACRTATDDGLAGADNFHDSNFITFHRLAGFRSC